MPLLLSTSHHSLLTENSFGNSLIKDSIKFDIEYLSNLISLTDFSFHEFDSIKDYIKSMQEFLRRSQDLQFRNIIKTSDKIFIDAVFKARYCLSLSYLIASDGLASGFEERGVIINKETILNKYPSSKIIIETIGDFAKERKLTPIQNSVISERNSEELQELIKPILMEAPCGEGKTLASLLYSEKLFKHNLINKVIFALPTQITSNNMFIEFNEEYDIPKNWIGIYHSEVLNFLINNKDDENYNPYFEKYENLIYSKPFNISTIDHLLLSLVNGYNYAPRAFGNICNSLVIIDELHYYDSHTLSLIEVLCEILRLLKIPHIIMSATIPSYIKNKFNNEDYLKIQSSGCDLNSIEKNPFNFSYHDKLIYEDDNLSLDFLKIIDENIDKNLGIIVNTVRLSQRLFEDIKKRYPNKQILLYNSQFMKKDRPIKEKLLKYFSNIIYDKSNEEEAKELIKFKFNPNEKFIFIGTQVAEISLNMSFDILVSELAPLDALIQRGGRLHRKMTFNNSKDCDCIQCQKLNDVHKYILHVFETGDYCYPYYTEDDKKEGNIHKYNIINNTREILLKNNKFTFKNSIGMINKVYNSDSFDKENENTKLIFKDKIREDLIFGKNPVFSEENKGELRIQTRNMNIRSIAVLPSCFYYETDYISVRDVITKIYNKNNYKDKFTSGGLSEIMRYMVNVTSKFYYNNKEESVYLGGYCFKIVKLNYTFEKGLYDDDNCS